MYPSGARASVHCRAVQLLYFVRCPAVDGVQPLQVVGPYVPAFLENFRGGQGGRFQGGHLPWLRVQVQGRGYAPVVFSGVQPVHGSLTES